MVFPEPFDKEVLKYCEAMGIPVNNGIVSDLHKKDIVQFIHDRLKRTRVITRRQEEDQARDVGHIVNGIFNGICKDDAYDDTSPIEDYLWDALKRDNLNNHVRRQFEIGTKRADFAFPIAKLVVECDGREYHREEAWQIEKDQKRDKYLARRGWRVIHLTGIEIRRDINLCIEQIREQLKPWLSKL